MKLFNCLLRFFKSPDLLPIYYCGVIIYPYPKGQQYKLLVYSREEEKIKKWMRHFAVETQRLGDGVLWLGSLHGKTPAGDLTEIPNYEKGGLATLKKRWGYKDKSGQEKKYRSLD